MKNKLVSICVASYNNSAYIEATLDSLAKQTYSNIEVIIVDDCSTDDSVDKILKWVTKNDKCQCHFVQNRQNSGVCKTFNVALDLCKGEYISIIGSDDILLNDKISRQVELFDELDSSYGLIYTDAYKIKPDGSKWFSRFIQTHRQFIDIPQHDVFMDLLIGNYIPIMSVLWKRECFENCGNFDEELSYEDYDMLLRTARKYKFAFLPYISAEYRIHSSNLTGRPRSLIGIESDFKLLYKHIGVSLETDNLIKGKLSKLLLEMSKLNSANLKKFFNLYSFHFSGFRIMDMMLKVNINRRHILSLVDTLDFIRNGFLMDKNSR